MKDFHKDLGNSNEFTDILDHAYKHIFEGTEVETITNIKEQKEGIDKKVYTSKGILFIEEKIRFVDYGDILLELYSSVEYNTPGWAVDNTKKSHYIAYFIGPTKKLIMINYMDLRSFTQNNFEWLVSNYKFRDTRTKVGNGDKFYTTRNVPIPLNILNNNGVGIKIYNLKQSG